MGDPQGQSVGQVTLTTYKRPNDDIGDYGWVTELESVEADAEWADEPVEYVEEVWVRQAVRRFLVMPLRPTCELEDQEPCEEDSVGWWCSPDGVWMSACEKHGGKDVGRFVDVE